MEAILLIYAIAVTIYALVKKISLLAILLYYAEKDVELPNDADIQKYTLKACKKLFHIGVRL